MISKTLGYIDMKKLFLKRREEKRIQGGHLWIFSNEVESKLSPLKDFYPGEQAIVTSSDNTSIGAAYVNPHSLICARLFSRDEEQLNYSLLLERLKRALSLRQRIYSQPYYRLVYGESDLLPGLVVDRFGPHLSVQLNTAGMDRIKQHIVDALRSILRPESILLRNDSSVRLQEGLSQSVEGAFGSSPELVDLYENGVHFRAPLHAGQKTGWFYDQRDNRKMLKKYVKGRRVLDVFSYIGGFCIQAAAWGAKEIWAVDASRTALEMAEENAKLNGVEQIFTGAEGDGFHVLKALREEKESFDVIVVDPPAFIKRKKDHKEGFRAYKRINELALRLLAADGILVSASCSMHLQRNELVEVVRHCAQQSQRHIQIVEEGRQGADHPVHPAIPETHYLKAFASRIL